jgi:hypothetical protein
MASPPARGGKEATDEHRYSQIKKTLILIRGGERREPLTKPVHFTGSRRSPRKCRQQSKTAQSNILGEGAELAVFLENALQSCGCGFDLQIQRRPLRRLNR